MAHSDVMTQAAQLRQRMREKARRQDNHIRWQNHRVVELERLLDDKQKKLDDHIQAERAAEKQIARLKKHIDKVTADIEDVKAAARRAGVWDVVKDELTLMNNIRKK